MVLYKCNNCLYQINDKSKYTRHLNRKNPCKKVELPNTTISPQNTTISPQNTTISPQNTTISPQNTTISPQNTTISPENTTISPENTAKKTIKCNYCLKSYTRIDSLNRHIKSYCKIKKQDDHNKEQIYQQLLNEHLNIKNENKDIKNELIEIRKKLSTNKTINNNTKNINNGIINNIQIVAHGKEDLSQIKENVIIQLVKRGWRSVPMFTEYLHCNDKFPEQKNIYINDINRQYCMVYNGNEWLLKDKTETIDELYQTKYDFLEENFNTYYDQLEEYQQRSFKKFIKLHEEDKPFVKKIKEELKTLLYNKRETILNNK
jgi:hypothetical protein